MTKPFPFLGKTGANALFRGDGRPWDEVLYETDHFAVVPTVGALVEGWLLIVTKQPHLCMGAVAEELLCELSSLKDHVSSVLRQCYGEVAVFEHGPSKPRQGVGCGVDHAHLHVLPVTSSLTERVPAITDTVLEWRIVESVHATRKFSDAGIPYLYVEQPIGKARIAAAWDAPSQLFRRVVADAIGLPEEFDWRNNPMESNVISTVEMLRGRFSDKTRLNDIGLVVS